MGCFWVLALASLGRPLKAKSNCCVNSRAVAVEVPTTWVSSCSAADAERVLPDARLL